MFCVKCGAQLPEGSAFCTRCGAPVQQKTGAEAPAAEQGQDGGAAAAPPATPDEVPYELVELDGIEQGSAGAGKKAGRSRTASVGSKEAQADSVPLADYVRELRRFIVKVGVFMVVALVCSVVGDALGLFEEDFTSSYTENPGYASAEAAADALGEAMEVLFNADTEEELLAYGDAYLSLSPGAYVDALLQEEDLTEKELCELIVTTHWGVDTLDEALEELAYYDGVAIAFDFEPGEALSADEVADLNDDIDDSGLDFTIEAGYCLSVTMYASFELADDAASSEGSTETAYAATLRGDAGSPYARIDDETTFSSDLSSLFEGWYVVEIDGAWYVW